MNRSFLLFLFFLFTAQVTFATSSIFIARIPSPSQEAAHQLYRESADIASYVPGKYIDLVLNNDSYEELKNRFPDLHIITTEAEVKQNLILDSKDIPGYRTYADMLQLIADLQAQYPGMLRVQTIGESWGKIYTQQGINYYSNFQHDIIAIMLSDNADIDEDEPAFYFMGAHHAREPISTEVCLDILIHFLESYGSDQQITDLVNSSELWFIPIVNPDGHRIVLTQQDTWWRKNIRDNDNNQTIQTTDGVDLNRNYGYEWGYVGSTDDPNYPTYHGPGPFSEPESNAVRDFLETRHFVAGISYHSYGELVLYPFGFISDVYAPDHSALSALGVQIAESIPSQISGHYSPSNSWELYPAAGNTDDWAYGHHGIFAYTIELATQFIPPANQVPGITTNNLEAARILVDRKNRSTLTGHVLDAETSEPVVATIYIPEIDDRLPARAPYKSNASFGSFYRFLPVGEYTVHFHAQGYHAEQRTITISNDTVTIEEVQLTPSVPMNLNVFVYDDNGIQISEALVSFPDLPLNPIYTDEMGIATFTNFMSGSYTVSIEKEGYEALITYRQFNNPNTIVTLMSSPMIWDDFEGGMGSWVATGNWGISSSHAYGGSYSLSDSPDGNYSNNNTTTCMYDTAIALAGFLNANLKFAIKHALILDGDYLALQISQNGQAWQSIDYFTGTSAWIQKSYSLNNYMDQSIRIRFLLTANSSGNADGVYIDNFQIFLSTEPVSGNSPALVAPFVSIYPNPFSDNLNLIVENAESKGSYAIDIFNLRGQHTKRVFQGPITSTKQHIQWQFSSEERKKLASGVYFVKLSHEGRSLVTRKILYIK